MGLLSVKNSDTLVLSFRGTATLGDIIHDINLHGEWFICEHLDSKELQVCPKHR